MINFLLVKVIFYTQNKVQIYKKNAKCDDKQIFFRYFAI